MTTYNELQLDALRELANIGSGNAATALSSLLGRPIEVSVPSALALPFADAIDAVGSPEQEVVAVALPLTADVPGTVLMLFAPEDAGTLCALLGVDADSELGRSALGEIANILGSSYVGALATMTGLQLEPHPPLTTADMLGAVVAAVLAESAGDSDLALLLDSNMLVEGERCAFTFMLVPDTGGVALLLATLGL